MFKTKGPSPLGTLVAAVALALSGAAAHAESACKGLEMAACEKAAECTWVGDYTRQDGIKVSGYCRTKTSPGGTKASPQEGAMKPSQEAVSKPAPTGAPAPAPAGAAKPAPVSAGAPAAAGAAKPAQDDAKKAKDAEKPKEGKKKPEEDKP